MRLRFAPRFGSGRSVLFRFVGTLNHTPFALTPAKSFVRIRVWNIPQGCANAHFIMAKREVVKAE